MNSSEFSYFKSSSRPILDLGMQPVSNRFLPDSGLEAPKFPLQLNLNLDTGLVYIDNPFPVEELKPRYDWLTCFEPEDHLDALVEKLIALPGIAKDSVFGAYSFKDDSTLQRLQNLGYAKNWRIHPEQDLGIVDPCASVETYQAAFTPVRAQQIRERYGPADVLIVRHVIEHSYNLPLFLDAMRSLIKPDGYIVWELPDCERALAAGDCTTIWEEHIFYFTSFTFKLLLQSAGFSIISYESFPYPLENSIVAIVREAKGEKNTVEPDTASLQREIERAHRFADAVAHRRQIIREKLEKFREKVGGIALFGAGHLSVAFLSILGVYDLIDFVIDDNTHKKGMKMPVGKLEIRGSDALYSGAIKLCLLGLNPHNQPKVVAKHGQFEEQGGLFASIFPGSDLNLEKIL